ncbi:matrix-remodeling-associated protein 7-like isoform X2 [Limanda limanda]|uniref:matrix-remodeling-associated protein 7-like isoform X2 n=1 Tax=Limanda limanda TaxID=27771 RepID=UPI0029C7E964|nr:matrix-remodeling-associated protein 7-like isoform X2 [Limanda limanda]
MDLTFLLSAIIFTLLAVVVGTSLLGGSSPVVDFAQARGYFGQHRGEGASTGGPEPLDPPGPELNGLAPEKKKQKKPEQDNWCETSGSSHDHWDVVKCVQSTEGATESPGTYDKMESNDSLKYIPGKSRAHHLQKMMSTDELEEEQRVQREQLAAIFHLLKDNQETFGEVSEGDMEDQLRLYSI